MRISGRTAADKVYDGTVAAVTLSGVVGSEMLNVTASGNFADKNAGSAKSVAVTYTLADGGSGGLAANYVLAGESLAADITPAGLTVSADNQSKIQGQANPPLTYQVGGAGLAAGDNPADVFSGAMATSATTGSLVGDYAITRGTLATNGDCLITDFNSGILAVTAPAAAGAGAGMGMNQMDDGTLLCLIREADVRSPAQPGRGLLRLTLHPDVVHLPESKPSRLPNGRR